MKGKKHVFSGFPGDCSPEQIETLAKFRQEVRDMGCTDPPYDDNYLLRFLRARKFDLPKTLIMWKNFIQWRKDNDVDNILNMKFPEMAEAKKHYPHGYFRTDKEGRPIYIERIGYLKFDSLVKIMPMEKMQLYFIQSYERVINEILPACSRAKGTLVDQTCYIIDLKHAGAKMMSPKMWDIIKLASKIGQDYYPEILGQMFIVNVPLFFYGIWNMIKHFLDEKTTKKIHLLGSKYHKELAENIPNENIPDFLGGLCTVEAYGDPFTCEQGPWKTEKLLSSSKASLPNEEEQKIDTSKGNQEAIVNSTNSNQGSVVYSSSNQEAVKSSSKQEVVANSEGNQQGVAKSNASLQGGANSNANQQGVANSNANLRVVGDSNGNQQVEANKAANNNNELDQKLAESGNTNSNQNSAGLGFKGLDSHSDLDTTHYEIAHEGQANVDVRELIANTNVNANS